MKYVSDLKELNGKVYDSVADLEAAEASVNEAIAEKQKRINNRKEASAIVDQAIIDHRQVVKESLQKKKEAYKKYLAVCDECDKAEVEARAKINSALKDFCAKYPEGYHSTIKFDDGTMQNYSYRTANSSNYMGLVDLFDKAFKIF